MTFSYKKSGLILYVLIFLFGIFTLFSVVSTRRISAEQVLFFLISLVLMAIGLYGLGFYAKNFSTVIEIDDLGISKKSKHTTIYIGWNENCKVRTLFLIDDAYFVLWGGLFSFLGKSSFIIELTNDTNTIIEIGSEIPGINKIVYNLKSKLGDKFDTRKIPLKYKFVKK